VCLHQNLWTHGVDVPLDLPALIDQHIGMNVNVESLSRAAFYRAAKKHVWNNIINDVAYKVDDIVFTER
jgi:hypothetical protein